MHILIFSHYFPPEVNAPASRMFEMARQWIAMGHSVTVVTAAPNHPRGELFEGYENRFFAREVMGGIEVLRVWTLLSPNAGVTRRILSFVSYLLSVLLNLWRIPKADVTLSTSPQFFCGLTGLLSQRRPWVLEIRDLWPKSIYALGAMKRGGLIAFLEWLERLAYRKADGIVSLTRSFVAHIVERGGGDKVEIITNGVDLKNYIAGERRDDVSAFRRANGLVGKTVAAYVGTHGLAHRLETVLDAAELLAHRDDIAFLLVGDGSERDRLEREARDRGLSNVVMLEQMPKAAMPVVWEATDISLIVLRDLQIYREVLPSKMFEAMAMERPIVLGVGGEARELLDRSNAGIAAKPDSGADIARSVEKLTDDPALRAQMGAAGRAFASEHFDRAIIAERYAGYLEQLVKAHRDAQ